MNKSGLALPIALIILMVLCCCLILVVAAAIYVLSEYGGDWLPTPTQSWSTQPTEAVPTLVRPPVGEVPLDTLELLEQTIVPDDEYPDIVCRFRGICGVPLALDPVSADLRLGTQASFWVTDSDTNEDTQVMATLRYITAHAYFWVENSVPFTSTDEADMRRLLETFETQIYPTDREFFGSEWTPGVDGDAHIYILYTPGMGSGVAGYYSSSDEYPVQVRDHSNAHEMFFLASSQALGDEYTYGVLAHEFQHMIHWHQDRNEGELLDEGFSELATFLNGYDTGGFDWYYTTDPDINLTDWSGDTGQNDAHYGANFLLVTYFLDRFGESATQALVRDQANGLESVDQVLAEMGATDGLTGQAVTADDFFLDWVIANFVGDGSVADGRYAYANYANAPQTYDTEQISSCPSGPLDRAVNQYGVDYLRITCPGPVTLSFTGSTRTRVVPTDVHSGAYAFWSNKGNSSDMTLTREFDLTAAPSGPIMLNYWTWYDLETDYDYLYVLASTDGEHWTILITPSGTPDNPTGGSFGWAYNGQSRGWREESVDLSAYAGGTVSIRFEYVTDLAVTGEGFLLDDVSLDAIGYSTDFESDDGGWQGAGFVRIENVLPQTYRLALITTTNDGTSVRPLELNSDQTLELPLELGSAGLQDAVLVVTATTRNTRELAAYQIEIR